MSLRQEQSLFPLQLGECSTPVSLPHLAPGRCRSHARPQAARAAWRAGAAAPWMVADGDRGDPSRSVVVVASDVVAFKKHFRYC